MGLAVSLEHQDTGLIPIPAWLKDSALPKLQHRSATVARIRCLAQELYMPCDRQRRTKEYIDCTTPMTSSVK